MADEKNVQSKPRGDFPKKSAKDEDRDLLMEVFAENQAILKELESAVSQDPDPDNVYKNFLKTLTPKGLRLILKNGTIGHYHTQFEALVELTVRRLLRSDGARNSFFDVLFDAWRMGVTDKPSPAMLSVMISDFIRVLDATGRKLTRVSEKRKRTFYLSANESIDRSVDGDIEKLLKRAMRSWFPRSMWETNGIQPPIKKEFKRTADPASTIARLVEELIPPMSDEQLLDLKSAIHAAQENPPADKHKFAKDVARILEARELAIVSAGKPYRLRVSTNMVGIESLLLAGREKSRGTSKGFRSSEIDVVPESQLNHTAMKTRKVNGPE